MNIEVNNDEMERGKIKLLILSGDVIRSETCGPIRVDVDSVKRAERVAIDYNHDDGDVLGYCDGLTVAEGGLVGEGTLLVSNAAPSARAKEVFYNLQNGVPYEASALLDFDGAEESVEVVDDEMVKVYRGATLRGVAICPHGADKNARTFLALSRARKRTKEEKKMEEIKEEAVKVDAPAIDERLTILIDEFGEKKGLEFYLKGLTIDDARSIDYEDLKAARAAAADRDGEKDAAVESVEVIGEKKLAAKLDRLESRLTALSAFLSASGAPVGASYEDDAAPRNLSAIERAAQAFAAKSKKGGAR